MAHDKLTTHLSIFIWSILIAGHIHNYMHTPTLIVRFGNQLGLYAGVNDPRPGNYASSCYRRGLSLNNRRRNLENRCNYHGVYPSRGIPICPSIMKDLGAAYLRNNEVFYLIVMGSVFFRLVQMVCRVLSILRV